MSNLSKIELRREILKQHKANQKIVSHVKTALTKIKNNTDVIAAYVDMYVEQGGELHELNLEHVSIAKDYKLLSSRNSLDRIFLETLGILVKHKSKKITTKNNSKSKITRVGEMVGKIKSLGKLRIDERQIILGMLDDIKNDLE